MLAAPDAPVRPAAPARGPDTTRATRTTSRSWRVAVAAAVVGAACSDAPVTTAAVPGAAASFSPIPASGLAIGGHKPVSAAERQAARQLARAIAVSLRDPAVLEFVKIALAASTVREQKLHFASFLSGRGGALVAGMVRDGGVTLEQIGDAVRSVRDLELYMPVRTHRERWTGAEPPLVALVLNEEDTPEAFNAIGAPRLLNRVYPPTDPVLVLVPVESDFARQIALNTLGKAESACIASRTETLAAAAQRCSSGPRLQPEAATSNAIAAGSAAMSTSGLNPEIVGLYATEIAFERNECGAECWGWGDPEYEIHVHGKRYASDTDLWHLQCVGDGASDAFWQPGDRSPEYNYDQNGPRYWAGKVKVLSRQRLEQVLAADASGPVFEFWEDDSSKCLPTHLWLSPSSMLVSAAGAYITRAAWRDKNPDHSSQPGIAAIVGVILSTWVLFDLANGGDDLIGVGVDKDSTPFHFATNTRNNVVILNDDGQYRGRATIKLHTAAGPYIGPVATVKVSHPPSMIFPVGSSLQASAYGVDADGWNVPGRPVSWSSSNPAVASVDASGYVTGHQEGSTTITATIDGVSSSIAAYPRAIGDPVAARLDHESVVLQPGQWMYIYARLYDSNGFEVPTEGNFDWFSSNPSHCQVGYGSTDNEAYIVANGGTGATITVTSSEGLSDSLYCSSNGVESKAPARMPQLTRAAAAQPEARPARLGAPRNTQLSRRPPR